MSKVLDEAVTSTDEGQTWDFRCPGIVGSVCGDTATGVPFLSTGWPTKKTAKARGQQHFDDHKLGAEVRAARDSAVATEVAMARAAALADAKDGEQVDFAAVHAAAAERVDHHAVTTAAIEASQYAPMQSLHEFRVEQGLVVNDDGSVSLEDL